MVSICEPIPRIKTIGAIRPYEMPKSRAPVSERSYFIAVGRKAFFTGGGLTTPSAWPTKYPPNFRSAFQKACGLRIIRRDQKIHFIAERNTNAGKGSHA